MQRAGPLRHLRAILTSLSKVSMHLAVAILRLLLGCHRHCRTLADDCIRTSGCEMGKAACALKMLPSTCVPQVGRLTDALQLIKDAKEAELAAGGNGELSPGADRLPSAEDGLKHLMLFTDVETLYR